MMRRVMIDSALLSLVGIASTLAVPAVGEVQADAGRAAVRAVGSELPQVVRAARRILFLGDSITFGGKYVAYFEAWLWTEHPDSRPLVINAGLPSETVSGLSEEGHAGGKFPRPDLAERLQRVLDCAKPDLVFACYGINCGIYQPFDAERFRRYKQGIHRLRQAVEARGAQLVLVTPPVYDDQRAKKPFLYNDVLDRYSEWLMSLRDDGVLVIDLHEPMSRELAKRREEDPAFTFQPDAVHPNAAGHWFMAQQLIRACSPPGTEIAPSAEAMVRAKGASPKVLELIDKRMQVLRNAYLSAAGHKRPGIAAGLPVEGAHARADQLASQIDGMVAGKR